mmetsp:Transcript_22739/g.35956  ORF Transcript_22739/g.35956 Transcript_22739/m.35956 type:complete len:228 (+) Transcript_22739:427-1110(+)
MVGHVELLNIPKLAARRSTTIYKATADGGMEIGAGATGWDFFLKPKLKNRLLVGAVGPPMGCTSYSDSKVGSRVFSRLRLAAAVRSSSGCGCGAAPAAGARIGAGGWWFARRGVRKTTCGEGPPPPPSLPSSALAPSSSAAALVMPPPWPPPPPVLPVALVPLPPSLVPALVGCCVTRGGPSGPQPGRWSHTRPAAPRRTPRPSRSAWRRSWLTVWLKVVTSNPQEK